MLNNITMLTNTIFRNNNGKSVKFGMSLNDGDALKIIERGEKLKLSPKSILANIYYSYENNTTVPDRMVLDIVKRIFNALKNKGQYETKDILTVDALENIKRTKEKLAEELNSSFNDIDIYALLGHLEFVAKTSKVDVNFYPTVCVNNPLMTLNEFFKGDITFYGFREPISNLIRYDYPITRCDMEISTRCDWDIDSINRVVTSVIENAVVYRVIKKDSLSNAKWETIKHRQQSFKEMLQHGYKEIEAYKFDLLNRHVCYYLTEEDLNVEV